MIENWMIFLGIILLFIIGFFIFIPRRNYPKNMTDLWWRLKSYFPLMIVIIIVVAMQLIEINIIDQYATKFAGHDYAPFIHSFEGDRVIWFSQFWIPSVVYFFIIIYFIVYLFTLWFTPFSLVFSNEQREMKVFTYGLLLIYLIALPFYLFFPVTNVYTYYDITSTINMTVPSIEQFFYSTTTVNNCFPSLHVALALLIAESAWLTKRKLFKYFTAISAVLIIIAVIYLGIHWISDVIGGSLLSVCVFFVLRHYIKE
jgi:membrane-associated phospholipid phosphatase